MSAQNAQYMQTNQTNGDDDNDLTTDYLDYATLNDPQFSPTRFANDLILATNNANDTPLDLRTPLSRVRFDIQDLDSRLDTLTSTSSLQLLSHTRDSLTAGESVLSVLEDQVSALSESYKRLENEVGRRHAEAEETRLAATRLWETVRLGRDVSRVLALGRTLEAQIIEVRGATSSSLRGGNRDESDHRSLVRASNTILSIRLILRTATIQEQKADIKEGSRLSDINVLRTLKESLLDPADRAIVSKAEQIVSSFSLSELTSSSSSTSNTQTQGQVQAQRQESADDTRNRATSALLALYLLSPAPPPPLTLSLSEKDQLQTFDPTLLIQTLQDYLRRLITSSLASLTSALTTLPKLERTLLEVSARCQNIVALEALLLSIKAPDHPFYTVDDSDADVDIDVDIDADVDLNASSPTTAFSSVNGNGNGNRTQRGRKGTNAKVTSRPGTAPATTATATSAAEKERETLLTPLLQSLDTTSLPSYFWRSTASQLSARVTRIVKDGGVSGRTLKSNRDRVGREIRACVLRGSVLPGASAGGGGEQIAQGGNWEREAAVMVGAVVNVLGR